MSKLLHAGFRRYLKSALFYICLAAAVIIGFASGIDTREERMFNNVYTVFSFMAYAVLISLTVGREFSMGGFRNKLIAGYTKTQIFFSEYLLALLCCMILMLTSAIIFSLFNLQSYARFLLSFWIWSVAGVVLFTVCMVTLICALSLSVSKRVVAAVVSLVFIFISFYLADEMYLQLNFPEYTRDVWVEYGEEPVIKEELEKNPAYVDSPKREVYTALVNIFPIGQSIQYTELSDPMFSKRNTMLYISDEAKETLFVLPLYSIGASVLSLAGAYLIFRKKDIK